MSGESNGSGNGRTRKPTLEELLEQTRRRSMEYRVPTINLEAYEVAPDVIALVPRELCERHHALPVSRAGGWLIVAVADPSSTVAAERFAEHTGMLVECVLASEAAIHAAIAKYYG